MNNLNKFLLSNESLNEYNQCMVYSPLALLKGKFILINNCCLSCMLFERKKSASALSTFAPENGLYCWIHFDRKVFVQVTLAIF